MTNDEVTVDRDDLRRAMIVASYWWPGTSLIDGALHVLRTIYEPHPFEFPDQHGLCSRCGNARSEHCR